MSLSLYFRRLLIYLHEFFSYYCATKELNNKPTPIILRQLHRSANNGFVFVIEKLWVVFGLNFDVECESGIRISLSCQDFEIFEVMCSKNGGFR